MHRHSELGAESTVQISDAGEEVKVAEVLHRFIMIFGNHLYDFIRFERTVD